MRLFTIICGNCRAKIDIVLNSPAVETTCPACHTDVALEVFPALFRDASRPSVGAELFHANSGAGAESFHANTGAGAESFHAYTESGAAMPVLGDGATCFYHMERKAQTVCESCGRFLCGLCDVELAGAHLCGPCIEIAAKQKKARNLQREYFRFDQMALGLALVAIVPIFMAFTIITAPLAIFVSIYFWKRPLSVLPVGHGRFVLAILMACAALVFLALIAGSIMMGAMSVSVRG